MKNVTLSIPDELLEKSREYARQHGSSLNEMIRALLRKTVEAKKTSFKSEMESYQQKLQVDTRIKITRDDIYER